jgi:two-component system phosphate regulon sensor histidine kinase PhoR
MKISLAKEISIHVSITASIIAGTAILLQINANIFLNFLYPAVTSVVVFFLSYILTYRLLKRAIPAKKKQNELEVTVLSETESLNKLTTDRNAASFDNQVILSNQNIEIDRLKEMERYRKEYLGNVSHELKTPIFNIQGYVLTLLDGGLEDPSINRKYLDRAEKSINRLISIIQDLETISRLEAGELKLEKEEFNIIQLIEEVFEAQEIRAKKRTINLDFDKKYKKPIFVYADKMRMFQVLTNLITNSINYGNVEGRTRVSLSETEKQVVIEINDDGIGIAPQDIPRVFERFYRADKSRSRDQGGTGLGLAIVKHILEGHNQTIDVQSKLKKGTSFIFTLSKTPN